MTIETKGQLCGTGYDFVVGLRALECPLDPVAATILDAKGLGFALENAELTYHPHAIDEYVILQEAWIEAIADRVLAAAQAHNEPASTTALDPSIQPQERCVRARTV